MEKRLLIFTVALLFVHSAYAQTCDQTLSPGSNLVSAIKSAASGSTICLNDGNYGSVNLADMTRTGYVTVRSVNSQKATAGFAISNSDYIRVQDMVINGISIGYCSTNLQILNNRFTEGVSMRADGCTPNSNVNILIDGNTFKGLGTATWEGRLSIYSFGSNSGITVSNNEFSSGGCSDGIQILGGTGMTIGPGNIFKDLLQGSCSEHVDAIQLYGAGPNNKIVGNYFVGNTVHIGCYDGGDDITIRDNIFDKPKDTSHQALQLSVTGMLMEHNTFVDTILGIGAKSVDPRNSGWIVQNNIFDNSYFSASGDQPGCGSDCVMRYNQKSRGGSTEPTGTNSVTGNAVYVGSGSVTNWAGWQLASGSPGKNAANDGKDMGATIFGTAGACGDGICGSGESCSTCSADCSCACVPSCAGKSCGDNGCGGSCGICAVGQNCVSNQCLTSCSPNWQCTPWSVCSGNIQTRTCIDSNSCGSVSGKPIESQACGITRIEAESGTLISPMQAVQDSTASGGKYVQTATEETGTAVYSFDIATTGNYKLVAHVFSQNEGFDSFYFSIDNTPEDIWDMNPTMQTADYNVWRDDELTKRGTGTFDAPQYDPYMMNLAAGSHTFRLRGREAGTMIDYFYLMKTAQCTDDADSDCDGCISQGELMQYIQQWKSGHLTLTNLMEAIGIWKKGC